jgi:hypothetical protein
MGPLVILDELEPMLAVVWGDVAWKAPTLHEFLQPPPRSSGCLGGFQRHVQSKVTEELPSVE